MNINGDVLVLPTRSVNLFDLLVQTIKRSKRKGKSRRRGNLDIERGAFEVRMVSEAVLGKHVERVLVTNDPSL